VYFCSFVVFSDFEKYGASAHLNAVFKHFMLLVQEYDLVSGVELEPLLDVIKTLVPN
jgi:hypothetical protein